MWPLVVALLLGSACCGSAQLLFNKTNFVEFTACNETVVIPCFISNLGTKNINELYIKWIFKGKNVLIFDGAVNRSSPHAEFSSAKVDITELLKGNASLKLNKVHAIVGNYTCEVTELIREGETTVELKYRVVTWFHLSEVIMIITFSALSILLFWVQFTLLVIKSAPDLLNEKIFVLFVTAILITVSVIFGATTFSSGVGWNFCGMVMSTILHLLGSALAMSGQYFSGSVCEAAHGSLLISGLSIIALAELFGLVYMRWMDTFLSVFLNHLHSTNEQTDIGRCNEDIILPCSFENGPDVIMHWKNQDNYNVHSYYKGSDHLEKQDPRFTNRTFLFHREIHNGHASLSFRRLNFLVERIYVCYVGIAI